MTMRALNLLSWKGTSDRQKYLEQQVMLRHNGPSQEELLVEIVVLDDQALLFEEARADVDPGRFVWVVMCKDARGEEWGISTMEPSPHTSEI